MTSRYCRYADEESVIGDLQIYPLPRASGGGMKILRRM